MTSKTRKRTATYTVFGLGVVAVLGWAAWARSVDQECFYSIHVDLLMTPGETREQHRAHMDEVARSECRRGFF
ncbi:MAG: hypothetical protein AAFO80_06730 [Pseudomonadota bacterium]